MSTYYDAKKRLKRSVGIPPPAGVLFVPNTVPDLDLSKFEAEIEAEAARRKATAAAIAGQKKKKKTVRQ